MTTKHRVVFEVDSSMLSAVLSANDHSKGVKLIECELIPNGVVKRSGITRHRVPGRRSSDVLLEKMQLLKKPVTIEVNGELHRWWVSLGFSPNGLGSRMHELVRAGRVQRSLEGWELTRSGQSRAEKKK